MIANNSTVAVSAPGKVLLAGGYLVLDREYTGLVLGLDARIHIHIRPLLTTSGVALQEIIVKSPQFKDAVWNYGYRVAEQNGGLQVFPLTSPAQASLHPNPFVETTLTYVLSYITSVLGTATVSPAAITILADDSYYTSPKSADVQSFYGQRFKHFGVALWEAHKTGLGSSAALVTSLTAALLSHYLPQDTDFSQISVRERLHNLAQAAHCAAQGKIGSGFDVASAVYGPCIYRRFSPQTLSKVSEPGTPNFAASLKDLVHGKWDVEIGKDGVTIPTGLRLVMCDVDCGSQTPGMVKGVQAWRSKEPEEAGMLWTKLDQANVNLANVLKNLNSSQASGLGDGDYDRVRSAIADIRELIRTMSRLSGVPIEPPAQTALLDFVSVLPGVIGGVVPGAGGFDAVALLVKDDSATIDALQDGLSEWNKKASSTAAQLADVSGNNNIGNVGAVSTLAVREDHDGIRRERPEQYNDWILRREESSG